MRDIPGFGIWLALMTAMSGVVGCGPDKPHVGTTGPTTTTPGGRPATQDAASGGGGSGAAAGRPPPMIVQAGDAGDGATERPPSSPMATVTATDGGADSPGCAPAVATGGRPGSGGNSATASGGGPGGTAAPRSGGAGGGPAGGDGGRALGTGGAVATGGATTGASGGTSGMGGGPSGGGGATTGGASGSGGTSGSATGGSQGSGGATGGGGAAGPTAAPGELDIVELLINPASTDTGREWIELRNRTTHAIALEGLHVADAANDAPVDFGGAAAVLPPGGRAVLVQSADPAKNGGIMPTTAVVVGAFGTLVSLNNDADTISICAGACTGGGAVIDKVSWDATLGSGYDGHALVIDDAGKRCPATVAFGEGGSFGTPGGAGAACP